MKHWVNDRLAVADAPDADTLTRLAADGFHTIVDLRSDGEPLDDVDDQDVAPMDRPRTN